MLKIQLFLYIRVGNVIQIFIDLNLVFSLFRIILFHLSSFPEIFQYPYAYNFNPNFCLPDSIIKKSFKIVSQSPAGLLNVILQFQKPNNRVPFKKKSRFSGSKSITGYSHKGVK